MLPGRNLSLVDAVRMQRSNEPKRVTLDQLCRRERRGDEDGLNLCIVNERNLCFIPDLIDAHVLVALVEKPTLGTGSGTRFNHVSSEDSGC